MELIYRHEKPLFTIAAVLAVLLWLLIVVGSFGIALVYILVGFIAYLFVQSGFISWLRGTAVKVTGEQFPDIHTAYLNCCKKLEIHTPPDLYLVSSQGLLNALATRFLGRNFVVLFSDVVDALEDRPGALNFYIGHELGHIKRGHLASTPWLLPALFLPHLGAAYSRAREYTCDLHGLACCETPEDARFAIGVLAAGHRRWKKLQYGEYAAQAQLSGGFWMSFHEYVADYPWLVKRLAHIDAASRNETPRFPSRNPFAFLLGCFVFRVAGGGAIGLLVTVAMIGMLAAVAIPSYQQYVARAQQAAAVSEVSAQLPPLFAAIRDYHQANNSLPASLTDMEYQAYLDTGIIESISMDTDNDIVIQYGARAGAAAAGHILYITPRVSEAGVYFTCGLNYSNVPETHVPQPCPSAEEEAFAAEQQALEWSYDDGFDQNAADVVAIALESISPVLDAINQHYLNHDEIPSAMDFSQFDLDLDVISAIYIDEDNDLAIELTSNAGTMAGGIIYISMAPWEHGGGVEYYCNEYTTVPSEYLPESCPFVYYGE